MYWNALLVIFGLLVKFESAISEVISYFNAGLIHCTAKLEQMHAA